MAISLLDKEHPAAAAIDPDAAITQAEIAALYASGAGQLPLQGDVAAKGAAARAHAAVSALTPHAGDTALSMAATEAGPEFCAASVVDRHAARVREPRAAFRATSTRQLFEQP